MTDYDAGYAEGYEDAVKDASKLSYDQEKAIAADPNRDYAESVICPVCDGDGERRFDDVWVKCTRCDGLGFVPEDSLTAEEQAYLEGI